MDTLYVYSFVIEGVTTTYRSPRYLIHEPCYKCISDIGIYGIISGSNGGETFYIYIYIHVYKKKSRENLIKIAKTKERKIYDKFRKI